MTLFTFTGNGLRGVALAAATVAAGAVGTTPAHAVSPAAAVGIGLGALAVGSAIGSASPYYYGGYPYGYGYPGYYYPPPATYYPPPPAYYSPYPYYGSPYYR